MAAEKLPILSYATPLQRLGRFRLLRILVPFCAGLALGGCVASALAWIVPDFALSADYSFMGLVLALAYVGATAFYALVVLAALGCSSRAYFARPAKTIVVVGIACPVSAATLVAAAIVLSVLVSPGGWMLAAWSLAVQIMIVLSAIAAPFMLVRRTQFEVAHDPARDRRPLTAARIAAGLVLYAAMVAGGRWIALKSFDHECRSLAAWLITNHPTPGAYSGLALPANRKRLADTGTVDAVVLPDGRVVLVLKREDLWEGWTGMIYCSGPIKPGEIAADAYGLHVIISGIPQHVVRKQLDSQHFIAGWDE